MSCSVPPQPEVTVLTWPSGRSVILQKEDADLFQKKSLMFRELWGKRLLKGLSNEMYVKFRKMLRGKK